MFLLDDNSNLFNHVLIFCHLLIINYNTDDYLFFSEKFVMQ